MNKKILLGLVLCLFLVGIVSAELFTFDNVLDYSYDDMEVRVVNFFGLGGKIGKVELTSHNSPTEIKNIIRGKDRAVMYYDFSEWELYENGIGEVEFTDMRTGEEIDKDYHFAKATYETILVNDYKEVCTEEFNTLNQTIETICRNEVIGIHEEEKFVGWERLKNNDIPSEEIRIALITDVNSEDYIDGVWTIAGKKISRHAEWTESLNVSIWAWYSFNASAGSALDNVLGVAARDGTLNNMEDDDWEVGLIGNALGPDGTNEDISMGEDPFGGYGADFTINWWEKRPATTAPRNAWGYGSATYVPIGEYSYADKICIFGSTGGASWDFIGPGVLCTDSLTINAWDMITLTRIGDNCSLYRDGVVRDSTSCSGSPWDGQDFKLFSYVGGSYYVGLMDEMGIWLRGLSMTEVDQLYNDGNGIGYGIVFTNNPNVTIQSPENTTYSNPINFSVIALDEISMEGGECWVTIDGGTTNYSMLNASNHVDVYNYTAPSVYTGGGYLAEFYCDNSKGNINNSESVSFYMDTAGVNIISPLNNTNWSDNTLDVEYIASGIGISCWYSNDSMLVNQSLATCGTNITTEIWSDGEHDVIVYVEDGSGNLDSSRVSFLIDTTYPLSNVISPRGLINYHLNGTNLTIVWSVVDTNLESCWYDYTGTNITVPCLDFSRTFNITSTNNNLTFYANDSVGNEASNYTSWSFKVFENFQVYNSSTYETTLETFILNMTTDGTYSVTADFIYNSSNMGAGAKTGSSTNVQFLKTLDVPITGLLSNRTFYWDVTHSGSTINTTSANQTGHLIYFTACNTTYTTPFLNISFKDESDLSYINASIPTSTFVYYLGSGSVNKTYSLINNTANNDYIFCASPNKTFYVDSQIQYKSTDYPQRIYNPSVLSYTNSVTNTILYLLNEVDGIYVTFQVINSINQLLSSALVSLSREIEGSDVSVANGLTGADGLATFWLNPDFSHDLSVSKSGYTTYSTSIFPTQTEYTITLSGGVVSVTEVYTRGMKTFFLPKTRELFNDTSYDFEFNLTSSYWELDSFGFNLRLANGTIVGTDSSITEGSPASYSYDVNNQSIIYMDYYWIVEGNTTSGSSYWVVTNTEYTDWSIAVFFTDLSLYLDSGIFGLDNFGRYLITFLILFIAVGVFSYKYGFTSPVPITMMIFMIVFFLDVVVGLIPAVRGIDYLVTYLAGLLVAVTIIGQVAR